MNESTHCYVGTLPCGCHVAAAVDVVDNKRETAKDVAEMIRNGYSVTRHALTELRDGTVTLSRCVHKEKQESLL